MQDQAAKDGARIVSDHMIRLEITVKPFAGPGGYEDQVGFVFLPRALALRPQFAQTTSDQQPISPIPKGGGSS